MGHCEYLTFHVLRGLRVEKLWVPMLASPGAFSVGPEQWSDFVIGPVDSKFESIFHVNGWNRGSAP